MPRPTSYPDVRTGTRPAPPVASPAWRWLALAVCLAFVVDGATTLRGLAAGGRELNPLVAGLAPGPYVTACVLRAAIAAALLACTARARRSYRHATQLGCLILITVKLVASACNLGGGV